VPIKAAEPIQLGSPAMNQSLSTPQSVVVGIDGSKVAMHAALWAVDEALTRDIPLRLLYAIEPDDPAQTRASVAARKLSVAENAVRYACTALEAVGKRVKIEVQITQERPITALTRASTSAAMVCVGAIGLRHFRSDRVGSTAAALAGSAHCPVAIIRGGGDPDGRRAGWIVVDVHECADNGVLLGTAIEEARLRNSPLRAITERQHSGDDDAVAESDRRIRANLDRRLARWTQRYPDVRAESAAVHGTLVDYLAANARSVQVVIVSARDRERVKQLVGPAGNAVLHNTACAVLIVDHQHL
jgi:nucleotide-binding universal stress UspA family protein